jgi:hypothetical protein
MKFLFLDIDGVMNSTNAQKAYVYKFQKDNHINWSKCPSYCHSAVMLPTKSHVANLNKIMTWFDDISIVISSSWRTDFTVWGWNMFMAALGVKGSVCGTTPSLYERRGDEIACWLDTVKEPIDGICIIDDDDDMGDLMPYLVNTDTNKGLTKKDAYKAIDILVKGYHNGS